MVMAAMVVDVELGFHLRDIIFDTYPTIARYYPFPDEILIVVDPLPHYNT